MIYYKKYSGHLRSLPRSPLITMYKSYIQLHLDYGDILYDQTYNTSFHQKPERIQYNAYLAGRFLALQKRDSLKNQAQSLQKIERFKKLCFLLKICKNESLDYLYSIIPQCISRYITKNTDTVRSFNTRHTFYKMSFFLSTTVEWNNLDQELRKCESYSLFPYNILKFIRSFISFFNCQNIIGIKSFIRLYLSLSHLQEQAFKRTFQNTFNPVSDCGMDVKSCTHVLL